jgi:DNA invertase Pin-like site-specific DNA recombinase
MKSKAGSDGGAAAILYAAKSTPDERESIPDQLKDGREFARSEGLPVRGEFSEQKVSAYTGDRGAELAAAMRRAEELQAVLVVQHSDRLARGDGKQARHLVEIALWALKTGVRIHCVEDPATFENLIMAVVMGDRNNADSRRKSDAVRKGHRRRRKDGKFPGGPAPYGYRRERTEADEIVLGIDPAPAQVVRRVFAEYLAGHTQLQIARTLSADGVHTGRGGRWHQGTVANILRNPIYAGMLRDDDGYCEGIHEPIVDREIWERAQALRKARARTHKRGRPSAGVHLFRKGMLRCGECGGSMVPRTSRNRNGSFHESYRCYERWRDPSACSIHPVARVAIDTAVYTYFEQVGLDLEATREQLAEASSRKLREARVLLTAAEGESQAAEARLARVRADYTTGELTAAEWRDFRDELEPEATAAEAEADRLRAQSAQIEDSDPTEDVEAEVLAKLAQIRAAIAGEVSDRDGVDAVRAALLRLFDGFVLHTGIPSEAHVELIGEMWIEPIVSSHAVAGYDEDLRPVLAQKPLDDAANNYADTFQP